MSHPFGDLLTCYRSRKHGLSQAKLAEMIGYNPAVITRMAQGQKDLTGTSGREHVLRVIQALQAAGALYNLDEANALLLAADMPVLYAGLSDEAGLIDRLRSRTAAAPSYAVADTLRHNLPVQLTSFVGRVNEIRSVKQMLAQQRLITLTGPGGVGKTRLAVEIGLQLLPDFADGIWMVNLTSLTEDALLARTVSEVVGVDHRDMGQNHTDVLTHYIAKKQLLLILDNCEHMVEACAHLVDRLLSHCANLRILTTSREVLAVPGEITWRIPPLSLAGTHSGGSNGSEALRLFEERTKLVQPSFALTSENIVAATQVCESLDGIPLALELAAALIQTFTVQEISARLDEGIVFSTGDLRTPDHRHRTLGKAVDWSYHLLTSAEQRLLARLSVFSGGWTIDAAQAICTDAVEISATQILPLLRQLAQKSLVAVDQGADRTRYRLLRTIRDYALEKVNDLGEAESLHVSHLNYFAQFAAQADDQLAGANHRQWDARLDEDYNNIRAALAWCKDHPGYAEQGLLLAARLVVFWRRHTLFEEGLIWLRQMINTSAPLSISVQAQGHFALLYLHLALGNSHEYLPLLEKAEQLITQCENIGDDLGTACLGAVAGEILSNQGQFSKAKLLLEKSLQLFEKLNDLRGIAQTRLSLATTLSESGNRPSAILWLNGSILHFKKQGIKWSLCEAYLRRADILWSSGKDDRSQILYDVGQAARLAEAENYLDYVHAVFVDMEVIDIDHAIALAEGYLERQRQRADWAGIGLGLHQLGRMHVNIQRYETARVLLDEAIGIWRDLGLMTQGVGVGLAWSLLDRGQVARFQNDQAMAEGCFSESIRYFKSVPYHERHAFPAFYRGHVYLSQGNLDAALNDFREALQLFQSLDLTKLSWTDNMARAALVGVAETYYQMGLTEASARMLGWSASLPVQGLFSYSMRVDYDRILTAAQQRLSDPDYAAAWEEGKSLSIFQAYAMAMGTS